MCVRMCGLVWDKCEEDTKEAFTKEGEGTESEEANGL